MPSINPSPVPGLKRGAPSARAGPGARTCSAAKSRSRDVADICRSPEEHFTHDDGSRASRRSGRDSLVPLRHALRATGISTRRRTGRPQEMDRVSPVVACPLTGLGRRLQRASIKDRRRRLGIPLGEKSNDRSQIMRDLLEDAGLHPAPGLLVDCGPRPKIVWQESPRTARPDHVTYCAQQIAQRMFALWSILAHQGQVWEKKLSFGIRDVAWIRLPCRVHATT